jgi:hypothetical protein
MRRPSRLLVPILVAIVLTMSSCSLPGQGTIPSGTPDLGNGTPAAIPSPGSTAQSITPAPSSALGATYAFVRNSQLWVALRGEKPVQDTSFRYQNLPDVSWHAPVWSPGDKYIAFIMNARPAGQGGGGCPAPDYGANGALYVLNTRSMQATQLVVPADKGDALAGSPLNGYWQYVFWEDATHLLAWYNGIIGQTSSTAGLYRYDLSTRALSQILPLSTLGVTTLFSAPGNQPLLLSMQYSSGQLYYQVVTHPFEQASQFIIYRRPLNQPVSTSVLSAGSEAWCAQSQSGPYVRPGWAISPDDAQLVAQVVSAGTGGNASQAGSVQELSLSDHTVTPLFAGLPAMVLAHDLLLAWGPDNQTVVASQAHLLSQDGPYSATLANPAAMQPYAPGAAGQAAWRSDSAAFALQSVDMADVSGAGSIYVYTIGNEQGQLLLMSARDFVWG